MSRLPLFALALLLMVGLALPATFADEEPAAPAPEKPKEEAKPKEEKADEVTVVPTVKLISAGNEPRQKLRYTPPAGSKTSFAMNTNTDVESMMGQMKIGPIKQTVEASFSKGSKDGQLKVEVKFTESVFEDDGTNPMAGMLKGGIEAVKGQSITGELSGCGVWTAAPGPSLNSAQQGLRGMLLGMMPPLPDEAVGVGAKWTVTAKVFVANMTQTAATTITITKIEGKRVEFTFEETRSAKDTVVRMGPQEIPVKKLTGTGKGKGVLDLGLGGCIEFSSAVDTQTDMEFSGQAMTSTAATKVSLKGKAATATTEAK